MARRVSALLLAMVVTEQQVNHIKVQARNGCQLVFSAMAVTEQQEDGIRLKEWCDSCCAPEVLQLRLAQRMPAMNKPCCWVHDEPATKHAQWRCPRAVPSSRICSTSQTAMRVVQEARAAQAPPQALLMWVCCLWFHQRSHTHLNPAWCMCSTCTILFMP